VKCLHYSTVKKKNQCGDLTVALTKTVGLGFEHIEVNVQFYLLISLNVVWLLCITFN
jgi:hypothetical protein